MNETQADEVSGNETPRAAEAPLAYRMVGEMAPLFEALATATAAFDPITKDRHVKVVTREKGTYEFDYATLEQVLACTSRALSDNGLKLWHFLCDAPDGAREIHHMLTHKSGSFLETVQVIRVKDGDGWQQFGSAVTYARRYQVQCILGVSAEHDDDGNAEDGNTIAASSPRQAPRREPPAPQPRPEPAREAKPASAPPKAEPIAPAPTKTIVDPGTGEPMSDELGAQITAAFRRLGYGKGPEPAAICKQVTGKSPRNAQGGSNLDQADGNRLLAYLKDEATKKGVAL